MRNRNGFGIYLRQHPRCEKCGSDVACEVHHIKPVVYGGDNSPDNLMTLCYSCHLKEHQYTRSELTKAGIAKARNSIDIHHLYVDMHYVIALLNDMLEDGEVPTVADMIDVMQHAPRKWIKQGRRQRYD